MSDSSVPEPAPRGPSPSDESALRLAAILDSSDDAIITKTLDSVITSWNPAAERLFGYAAAEIVGRPVTLIIPPERVEEEARILATLRRGQRVDHLDTQRRRKDGTLVDVSLTIAPIQTPDGRIVGAAKIARDLNAPRRAGQALRDNQAQLAAMIDSAMDAIVTVDAGERITVFNRAAEQIFGYPAAAMLGQPLSLLLPEAFREAHHRQVQHFAATGLTSRTHATLPMLSGRRADGSVFPIEAAISQAAVGGQRLFTVILRDVSERRRSEALVQRQLNRLAALRAIDLAISVSLDLRLTLQLLLEQVCSLLSLDAAGVYLLNTTTNLVHFTAGRGFPAGLKPPETLRLGQDYAGRVALQRQRLLLSDLAQPVPGAARPPLFDTGSFQAYVGLPLVAKGQVVGVLEVYQRAPLPPDTEWLDFLEALAGQAAIAIDNAALFQGLQVANQNLSLAYDATIESWSRALDLRDHETAGHSRRVSELAVRLAGRLGLEAERLDQLRLGALLHDIGKLGLPDSLLLKPGPLTADELAVMRQHPVIAHDLLLPIHYLRGALDIPYCHHEKWDGSGYPRGLAGETIPLTARILAVAEVWEALRSDRPYRRAWPEAQARAHLRAESGRHFDPAVLAAFERLLDEEG